MSFRKLLRAAIGVAALSQLATCSDFTGPGGRGVQVPIVPTFGAAANFAKALYAAAGLEYDRVRVVITRNDAELLKDTTVAFSPASPEINLPLVITANPGEIVTVTLEYRTADLVLYSGTQSATTVATGATPTTPPTPLLIVPVGPGASAETVELSPASGTFPVSVALPFTATAFTADHLSIANAIFGWTVDDATIATVNAQGVVTPTSKGGVAKIRATTLNQKFAEATITFITAPASVVVQSGGGQTAQYSDPLAAPVVVKVLDANGTAVPGATVNFAVASGGGSLSAASGVTNSSGLATVNWTLGTTIGAQSITATVSGVTALSISATATERPAKALAFGQQPSRVGMNAAITPAITVRALDDKGNVVASYTGAITVAFDVNPTGATLGGTLTANAVAGVATYSTLTVNKFGEGYKLKAAATGLTDALSNVFGIDQVASAVSVTGGASQVAAINTTLNQIVVKVADANGAGVPGFTVTFAVASGGGSIVVDNGVTDATGLARATWTLGATLGSQSITATATGLTGSPLTITATGTAPPVTTLAFGQQPTTVDMNTSMAPAVTVKAVDANGNTVTTFTGNVTLTLGTNPTGATLGGTTTVAAVAGVATFSNLSVNKAGTGYKLSAGSGTMTTVTSNAFNVNGVAAGLSLSSGGSQSGVIRSTLSQIVVKVADANGDGVAGVTVTFAANPGSGTLVVDNAVTDVDGLARATWTLGNTIGGQSMTATAGALTGSPLTITATGTPLPAVGLEFIQQPPASVVRNATLAPAVSVRAIDIDGNTVGAFNGNITLTLNPNPGSATLGGTVTVTASGGLATFSTLSVNVAATGYRLKASSGTLTTATSDAFNVTLPPPVALQFLVQPSNVVTGVVMSPAIQVRVVDAAGALVETATDSISISLNPLVDEFLGGTKKKAALNGVATFDDIYLSPPIASIVLNAKAAGLTSAVSNSFAVTQPPPVSYMWTGAVSTQWSNAGNWSPSGVPATQDSVTIVSATNQPVIDGNSYADAIAVQTGATLSVNFPGFIVNTNRVWNKGTLKLTAAGFTSPIQNTGTILVDSAASITSLTNATGALLSIKSTRGNGAVLVVGGTLTNNGSIVLDDTDGKQVTLSVGDSIVNKSGATITVNQGSGSAARTMSGTLRNYGAINVSGLNGMNMYYPKADTSRNVGSINVTGGGYLYQAFNDSTVVFENTGTMSLGASEWDFNLGHLKVKAGTVSGTGIMIPFRTQFEVDFSKFTVPMKLDDNSRFPGDSLNVLTGQTVKLNGGSTGQKVTLHGGTLAFVYPASAYTILTGGVVVYSGGLLDVKNTIGIYNGLSILADGRMTITANSTVFTEVDVDNSFTNNGTIELTSVGAKMARLYVPGTLTNSSTGTIWALAGAGGERKISGTLDNQGTINIDHDSYLNLQPVGPTNPHSNSGTINISDAGVPEKSDSTNDYSLNIISNGSTSQILNNSGTINVGANRTLFLNTYSALANAAEGVIGGTGSINQTSEFSTFTNDGTIKPGGDGKIGTLTYVGTLDLGKGTIEIDVKDQESFDLFHATGVISMNESSKISMVAVAGFSGASSIVVVNAGESGFSCEGQPTIGPAGWTGFNDGCVHVSYAGFLTANYQAPSPIGGSARQVFVR